MSCMSTPAGRMGRRCGLGNVLENLNESDLRKLYSDGNSSQVLYLINELVHTRLSHVTGYTD